MDDYSGLMPEIPADLEEVILRCLSKSPDDRFADVAELDKALDDCADVEEWNHSHATDWWKNQRGAPEPHQIPHRTRVISRVADAAHDPVEPR